MKRDSGHSSKAPAQNRLPFLAGQNRNWLPGVVLVAAVILFYLPVWHAGFIWDDDAHVTENPCVTGPLGFKGIWTTSAAVYYPLVLTSFWLQHAIWGLNPLPFHLVNVAVHAACAVLLWRVLLRLKVRGAWLGAALWALHPVQAESVAWITELKNTQSCLFYLLAIQWFLKWRGARQPPAETGRERHYALALLCAVLAILSKASTVMLPVVLGLCWWWLDRRWSWRNCLRLAPFFLISAAASGWTIWEQQFHSGAQGSEWAQTWPERIIISGKVIWFYFGKLLWPHSLIFIYPRWMVEASNPAAYLPVLAATVGLIACLFIKRNGPPLFFAFAYFVVSLFPVLDFFKVYFFRYSFVGDHFQYLASIGPLALAGAGLVTAAQYLGRKRSQLEPALGAGLLLVLGVLTWRQAEIYQNVETLWRDTLKRNPAAWMAHANLAHFLAREARWDEALFHFREEIRLNPNDEAEQNAFGVALAVNGHLDEAIDHFNSALQLNADFAPAHNDLGLALSRKGRFEEAANHFRRALEIDPGLTETWMNLGKTYEQQGRLDDAVESYRRAVAGAPNQPEPLRRLNEAEARQKQRALNPSGNTPASTN